MKTLKIDNFQDRFNVPQSELEVLSFWDETNAFEKSVSKRSPKKRYVFYDGPPFATGLPHYGHILASTIKDVVPRYWTMKGYRVDRVWGWDCHGIPIENIIEKELDLKGGKKGIEALGVDKFNAACRSAILRFDKEWEKVIRRIGRWVDFKHSYKTMDKTFMESVWWAFSQMYSKGFVYEGKRVILYCPRCATPLSNFEIAMDNSYKDLPGPSTTYKYKVVEQPDTYILAWSTTPWNKLATPALAVNPDFTYLKVKQGSEFYILAEKTVAMLGDIPYTVVEKMTGNELASSLTFEPHYSFYAPKKGEKVGVLIADSYVTDTEGTGVVTLAVYGEDDYRLMTQHNIQLIYHVDDQGIVKPEVTPWAGMFMLKVNPLVNDDLAKRGLVYHDEERVHSVPVCYRCETRLYHAPVPAWFFDVQKMKPALIDNNENINWYPDHLKHGRFGKGLETAPDWNVSRSRYWGTPMPVWRSSVISDQSSDKPQLRIIGSIEELKKWAVDPSKVDSLTDIHREFLDDLEVWVDDAKTVKGKRIPEVFDCWVESGSMPYASIHYPFENKELFEETHPAQFIAEYIAQTRAWFYTLHVMSVGLFGKNTFENAVTTGTILAEDGSKMSKSKKNYPDPSLLIEKYGVDALRFYLMESVVMKAENLNFSEKQVADVYQNVVSTLWNVFAFYKLYAVEAPMGDVPKAIHIMDKWIASKTQRLMRDVTVSMDSYDMVATCRMLKEFVSDFSTWYLRRSRNRIKTDTNAQAVFGWVLSNVILLLAPVMPFLAERMWQNLYDTGDSVHLSDWPAANEKAIDESLEKAMLLAREVVAEGHAKRKLENIPLKQPLATLTIEYSGDTSKLSDEVWDVILEELNVFNVKIGNTQAYPKVEVTITDEEIKAIGDARTLVRKIQMLRKEKGCTIHEKITLQLPKEYETLPEKLLDQIKTETVTSTILWGDTISISIG